MTKSIYYLKSLINHRHFLSPRAFLRMAKGTVLARLGIPRIRNVQMALTMRYNFKCGFCSSNLLMKKGEKELSLLEWKIIITELKALGCVHFDLTGGEPTILPKEDLLDLILFINGKRDSIVSLASNGWNYTAEMLMDLKAAGLTVAEFNVQSIDAEIHDREVNRPDSLLHTMKAMQWARQAGLEVCINTSLREDNWNEIEKLLTACDQMQIHCLLNLGAPTGRLLDAETRISARKEEYYRLLYSHPYARSDTSYNYRGADLCPGGVEKLYITAYGDVMQCTFVQVSFGNVRREPLAAIYKRFLSHPLIQRREQCKHTFNQEFRREWVNPIIDNPPPTELKDHPNYKKYLSKNEKESIL